MAGDERDRRARRTSARRGSRRRRPRGGPRRRARRAAPRPASGSSIGSSIATRTMAARGELGLEPPPAPGEAVATARPARARPDGAAQAVAARVRPAVGGDRAAGTARADSRFALAGRGRASEVAEHEVALAVRDVVERHGRERLDELRAVRRAELLDAAVDHAQSPAPSVARLPPTVSSSSPSVTTITCSVCSWRVRPDAEARAVVHAADEHLLAADRVDVHARERARPAHAVPGPERGVRHHGREPEARAALGATALTERSSSKITHLPSRVARPSPRARAAPAPA